MSEHKDFLEHNIRIAVLKYLALEMLCGEKAAKGRFSEILASILDGFSSAMASILIANEFAHGAPNDRVSYDAKMSEIVKTIKDRLMAEYDMAFKDKRKPSSKEIDDCIKDLNNFLKKDGI